MVEGASVGGGDKFILHTHLPIFMQMTCSKHPSSNDGGKENTGAGCFGALGTREVMELNRNK